MCSACSYLVSLMLENDALISFLNFLPSLSSGERGYTNNINLTRYHNAPTPFRR